MTSSPSRKSRRRSVSLLLTQRRTKSRRRAAVRVEKRSFARFWIRKRLPQKKSDDNQISRKNYDFAFLRRENFGVVPEYVLLIVPKRKARTLLLGQIWVDTTTFRIRRIEGVPAKNPSIWIKNIHITMQFAELNGAWIPVSFDAIANVRFVGQYTLTGLNVEAPVSTTP